jgi:hypothetical protein
MAVGEIGAPGLQRTARLAPPRRDQPEQGAVAAEATGRASGASSQVLVPASPAAPARRRRGRAIWRFALLALTPIVLAGLGAYAGGTLQPTMYAARSEIVFYVRTLGSSGSADRFLSTQPEIAASRSTLAPIAAEFGRSVEEIEKHLEVDLVRSSAMMRIEYADPSGTTALDVTRAITDRYLTLLRDLEVAEGAGHQVLSPAFLLEQPTEPRPLQAAAIGAVVGFAISFAGIIVLAQTRAPA